MKNNMMAHNDNTRKGKPINSSVPSFRFNATAEEIEELYASDEDHDEISIDTPAKAASDVEGSPYKSNKLGKRSTSVDVSTVDLSPPTDPWRFFTDIKGKITKSVEGKITEYKTRSSDADASPKKSRGIKEGKECKEHRDSKEGKEFTKESREKEVREGARERESSSLSESEELSESSISRTCGIVSTTEGVEMSSDDEGNTSLSDKKESEKENSNGNIAKSSLKQGNKSKRSVTIVTKDGKKEAKTTTAGFLEDLQNINLGLEVDQSDVESGVDVLAQINNIDVDADNINITQVTGEDIRKGYFDENITQETTIFSPTGFVDLRPPPIDETFWVYLQKNRIYCFAVIGVLIYFVLPLTTYMSGFIAGNLLMFTVAYIYTRANEIAPPHNELNNNTSDRTTNVKQEEYIEIPAVKEERPLLKYQGWVNEYPEVYDPYTYHISQTQSVYLRLQGNLLKISNTKTKIPKRASYNETEHKMSFTRHRIYNLLAAEIGLLPLGLTKIRHWSKKYPICIVLNKDQLCYDLQDKKVTPDSDLAKEVASSKGSVVLDSSGTQVFSRLIEDAATDIDENTFELAKDDDDTIAAVTTTSADELSAQIDDELLDDEMSFFDTPEAIDPQMDISFLHDPIEHTCIYIFARTDREKEHWFRRFKRATHRQGHGDGTCSQDSASDIVKDDSHYYGKYLKIMSPILTPIESGGTYSMFMAYYTQASALKATDSSVRGRRSRQSIEIEDLPSLNLDLQWMNTMIYRMVFDFHQSEHVIKLIQDRIAKKLAAIKLPIFIESLRMTELTFGNYAPKVCKIGKPHLDEWGLWTDFELSYEGSVIIMVLTKLNLLKLKAQGEKNGDSPSVANSKSAIYNSDVEDTAESSSDDEQRARNIVQTPLDDAGHPVHALAGASKQNKKFMNMMDRFAESRFFQRATEYKYIKKAIEGVSNTDVGLKLELKGLKGCLVVNVPPPPSDRIWFGFRAVPMPKLQLTAQPVVGERNWNFIKVSNWIEKRVYKEFLKVLLLPNMEDILIPGMDPRLPE